ncbi:MAG: hypothetical protein ACLR1D_06040 [Dialister sp.]
MTNQAFRQIHHKPENTMILDSTAPELELEPDFSFRWGEPGTVREQSGTMFPVKERNYFFRRLS